MEAPPAGHTQRKALQQIRCCAWCRELMAGRGAVIRRAAPAQATQTRPAAQNRAIPLVRPLLPADALAPNAGRRRGPTRTASAAAGRARERRSGLGALRATSAAAGRRPGRGSDACRHRARRARVARGPRTTRWSERACMHGSSARAAGGKSAISAGKEPAAHTRAVSRRTSRRAAGARTRSTARGRGRCGTGAGPGGDLRCCATRSVQIAGSNAESCKHNTQRGWRS